MDTARDMGITDPTAQAAMGLGFGGIEMATERIGGIGGDVLKPAKTFLGRLVKNTASEAGEEILAGRAQDALTVGAGQFVADPDRPGFTESGYQLPSLNPLNPETLAKMKQEAIGGAAGGLIFSGLQALSPGGVTAGSPTQAPPGSPASSVPGDAGSTPAAGNLPPRVLMSRALPSMPHVGFWRSLADDADAFQLGGEPRSSDLAQLAAHYSKSGQALTVTPAQPMDSRASEAWDIQVEGGGTAHLMRAGRQLWINTAGLDSNRTESGGGAPVYQLALSYAHNRGLQFRADPRGVKPVARLRRISHMISSVLRHGSSNHLDPLSATDDGYVEIPNWRPGQKDSNLADLLNREYHEVRAAGLERGIDIDALTVDPATNTLRDGRTGLPVTRGFYKALTVRFDARSSGVGSTTLLRALVVGSQRRAQSTGGGAQWNVLLSQLHAAGRGVVRNDPLLDGGARQAARAQPARGSAAAEGVAGNATDQSEADTQDNEQFRPFEAPRKLLYSKPSGAAAGRVSASAAAQALDKLRATAPALAQGVLLVPNRSSLNEADYHPKDWASFTGPDATEAFFDPRTGGVIVLTENVRVREGETAPRATARAILHERIGHAGLAALRQSDPAFAARWSKLMEAVLKDGPTAAAIAALHAQGYGHLTDSQLVEEWFARQVESMTPEQLQALKPTSTLGKLWQWLKDALRHATRTFNRADWTARELREIMALSRQALERGGPVAAAPHAAHELLAQQPHPISAVLAGHTGAALRQKAREFFKARLASLTPANQPVTRDGRRVRFTMTGYRESQQHSADARVLQIIPDLPQLITRAVPLWSESSTKQDKANILAFHHYGTKVRLNGETFLVRITLRQDTDGHIYYDNHPTDIEIVQNETGDASPPQPGRTANARVEAADTAKDRLLQWLSQVNAGTTAPGRVMRGAMHLPPLWDYDTKPTNGNLGNASLNAVIESGVQGGRVKNLKLQIGTVPDGRLQAGKFVWMDDSFVTHALAEHGDPQREDAQGQEALSAADFALLPHVVSTPDAVTPNKAAGGKSGVRFEKRVNGTLVFVTAEPNAKGQLRAVTMWKRRVGRVMPSKPPASTSATNSLTPGGANATPIDRAERRFGKRVRADERLDPQMRQHFGDPIIYDVAHNADTLAAANDFISQHGLEAAAEHPRQLRTLAAPQFTLPCTKCVRSFRTG